MFDSTRRSELSSLAALIPLSALPSISTARPGRDGDRFVATHALGFHDESDPIYRDVDVEADLTIDTTGEWTEITLVADFEEPERLEEDDIYSVQVVPKQVPDESQDGETDE